MELINKEKRIIKLFRYFILVFAFVCLGFVTKSSNVSANIILSVDDEVKWIGEEKQLHFYVGYENRYLKELKYQITKVDASATDSAWKELDPDYGYSKLISGDAAATFCNENKEIFVDGCSSNILEFVIVLDSDNFSEKILNSSGQFKLYLYAMRYNLFGGNGNVYQEKLDVYYDKIAPEVKSVEVVTTKSNLTEGDTLEFEVVYNESVRASEAKIKFYLGEGAKIADCDYNNNLSDTVNCSYEIVKGDNGKVKTSLTVINGNIEDKYSNKTEGDETSYTFQTQPSVTVDAKSPNITSIKAYDATGNEYAVVSEGQKVYVSIVFDEKITSSNKNAVVYPSLRVKFGKGSDIICEPPTNSADAEIVYTCDVGAKDEGKLIIVGLEDNNNTLQDSVGNAVSLGLGSIAKEKTVEADNKYPEFKGTEIIGCGTDDARYCTSTDKITIKFMFDDFANVTNPDIKLFFGENVAKASVGTLKTDSSNNCFYYEYNVNADDNGQLKIEYQFTAISSSGASKEFFGIADEHEVYADNKSPTIKDMTVDAEVGQVIDTTVYSGSDEEIYFYVHVEDATILTVDKEKVYLINEKGKIETVGTLPDGVKEINANYDLEGKYVLVIVVINGNIKIENVRLKIEKDAIKDALGNSLKEDYISDASYTIDCEKPKFTFEVSYPQYKGFMDNNTWFITSGNKVSITIKTSDKDRNDYCIYEKNKSECEGAYVKWEGKTIVTKEYSFDVEGNEIEYTRHILVRDVAGNETVENLTFKYKSLFSYGEEGVNSIRKQHTIEFDTSELAEGEQFYYSWFKEGTEVKGFVTNSTKGSETKFAATGSNTYNGNYRLCIRLENSDILCSEYVTFDNAVDNFSVKFDENKSYSDIKNVWAKEHKVSVNFSDISGIKCIAVGIDVSSLSCSSERAYSGNLQSPYIFTMNQNGYYHIYIEDKVGNKKQESYLIEKIDEKEVVIGVYNDNKEGYDTNLETNIYKNIHVFKVTLDKDIDSSPIVEYKYFFSQNSNNITNKDSFDIYYRNSSFKGNGINSSFKVSTPSGVNGSWHLYIMAIDEVGLVSFKTIRNIQLDSKGPNISMNGYSENIISSGYSISISDNYSDISSVTYNWKDSVSGEFKFAEEEKYNGCTINSTACVISKDNIKIPEGLSSSSKYVLVVTAYDSAGNKSTFTSNEFKIDTSVPIVTFGDFGGEEFNANKWYKGDINITFKVEKDGYTGAFEISYCLDDCRFTSDYSPIKSNLANEYRIITDNGHTGTNTLYVKAKDELGNSTLTSVKIKLDSAKATIAIDGIDSDGVIDFSGVENPLLAYTLSDRHSGIDKYYIYYEGDQISSYDVNTNEESKSLHLDKNGNYCIEVYDAAGNYSIKEFEVVGAEREPIEFNLISNIAEGKFTNGKVTITIANIMKSYTEDASSLVKFIDYIQVEEYLSDYSGMFDSCNSVYDNSSDDELVNNFEVDANGIYVVRIIDIYGNDSYRGIKVNSIDRDKPIFGDEDKVSVKTSSGSNFVRLSSTSYKYAKEPLLINFLAEVFKDPYKGINSGMAVKICFGDEEETSCKYDTRPISNIVIKGAELVNNGTISVPVPSYFNGIIWYYLVDGAGNESETKRSISVRYVEEVEDIDIELVDASGNKLDSSKKYNKVVVKLGNYSSDLDIKYSLVRDNIDMTYEFYNNPGFWSSYTFTSVNLGIEEFEVSKNNVDASYYVWVYICDGLGYYKLFRLDELIRMDTIAPSFSEIQYPINKEGDNKYSIVDVGRGIYDLLIDKNNDDVYEKVDFKDGKYEFSVTGVDSIKLKLKDSAGNFSEVLVVELASISATPYGRVYQNGNDREAKVVIYNMGINNITSFKYIVTNVDDDTIFNNDSLNGLHECSNASEVRCWRNDYSNSSNVYTINVEADRKIAFYIYVGGNLVYDNDKNGKIIVIDLIKDDEEPVVAFDSDNPTLVSTINGTYSLKVSVTENNLSNLNNIRYVLSKDSAISSFNSKYDGCYNSDSCVRGVYNLVEDEEKGIIGTIILNKSSLVSGWYYLYTYVVDDYGHGVTSKSSAIYVDNDKPVISYSYNNEYLEIEGEAYLTYTPTLLFTDNKGISSYKIYNELGNLVYTGNGSGLQSIYYNLDTGIYTVEVYDMVNNMTKVKVIPDRAAPVIKLYKKISDSNYSEQLVSSKLYNSLNDLFVRVNEENFNYLTIDLHNTVTGEKLINAARYSYNSSVANSLVSGYGVELTSLLFGGGEYNRVIIKVYDKANRYGELVVNYDDVAPIIWTKDIGENIKIDSRYYTIKENYTINFEIGVHNNLVVDKLLNQLVMNVDGFDYGSAKDSGLLDVKVYKKESLEFVEFNSNIFDYVGNYKIEIGYMDVAGNSAESKIIYVNVSDNIAPIFNFDTEIGVVELNEDVVIDNIVVSDNYGFDANKTKQLILTLEDAVCTLNGSSCYGYFTRNENTYKFIKKGTYNFKYLISDISSNLSTLDLIIEVKDTKGPNMTTDEQFIREIFIGERVSGSDVNVESVTFKYPSSRDSGDGNYKTVEYVGLFARNANGEKYKADQNMCVDNETSLTCKFVKVGTYYLRFTSSDSNDNTSLFEYEVVVRDNISPVINGISDKEEINVDLELGNDFNINDIISEKNITVSDNYDETIDYSYSVKGNEVKFTAIDTSGNTSVITVYVKLIDKDAPVSGSLKVDEKTNSTGLSFSIIGGSDNSSDWHHQYSINNVDWFDYVENSSKLSFEVGINKTVNLCIRAIDGGNNTGQVVCQSIEVDTKAPVVKGIDQGQIVKTSIDVEVSDENGVVVEVYRDGELVDIEDNSLAFTLTGEGIYCIKVVDSFGNVKELSFAIESGSYTGVINDVGASEYEINSIAFEEKMLVKVEVEYDEEGNSVFIVDLEDININSNYMAYILGVAKEVDATFVIYTLNGSSADQYESIKLIGEGEYFIEGVNNEDCFVKVGDSYYAYLVTKEKGNTTITNSPVTNSPSENGDDGFLNTLLIIIGSLTTLIVGYQIIKLRRRVRAA